jgi:serine phosphatase RsbU (regulator of sigma subunit)
VSTIFIYNRFKVTNKQKNVIHMQKEMAESQKHLIEEKQKEIIDSINYAKRIQFTLLAHDDLLLKNLPEHFVLFKPKDIVSGDFYWATERYDHIKKEKQFYLAVCDSTGHGVPGAFMGLLNTSFLNEAVNEKNIHEPAEVFEHVRSRLVDSISRDGGKDGMDAILIKIVEGRNEITYAAAYNKPLLVRKGELIQPGYDKIPIGQSDRHVKFSQFSVKVEKGDVLYLYTDGYADQFGGKKGGKLKEANLKKLLAELSAKSMEEQKLQLESEFNTWRGELEQVDDVCVIGIRF